MIALSIFKIALMTLVMFGSTLAPTSEGIIGVLVYKAREKTAEDSMSATESIVIQDISTGLRHTIITYTNTIEPGMGYAEYPLVASLDGRFVFNIGDGHSYVWEDNHLIELPEGYNYQWSAAGELAFIGIENNAFDIYTWAEGELTPLNIAALEPDFGNYLRFDRGIDGRFLIYSESSAAIYIWDGENITNINPEPVEDRIQIMGAAWSMDGRIAFVAGSNPNWALYIWDDGAITSPGSAFTSEPAWSADGRLAYTTGSSVYIWDGAQPVEIGRGVNPLWSMDGQYLAFVASNRDTLYMWDGSTLTDIPTKNFFSPPAWSTDGRLALANQDLYIWDAGIITIIPPTPTVDEIDPQWLSSE